MLFSTCNIVPKETAFSFPQNNGSILSDTGDRRESRRPDNLTPSGFRRPTAPAAGSQRIPPTRQPGINSSCNNRVKGQPNDGKSAWLDARLNNELAKISRRRGCNVIVYASGFLQNPAAPSFATSINREDIHGLMCAASGLDDTRGLSLILHTPGGEMTSTETMVDYLRSKFEYIEAIVPVYAMSGGTMIALNANKIVMGKQSQLGPIDAQLQLPVGSVSASSILDQFNTAREEIDEDREAVVAWAPILQTMGPSLLSQAQKALELGQQIAERGLTYYMFAGTPDSDKKAKEVAEYFNSEEVHLRHGRRIGVEECAHVGLTVERLEEDQAFQDEVLTAYHLITLGFEQASAVKVVRNHNGQGWVKNFQIKQ